MVVADPSLSRDLQDASDTPDLLHSLNEKDSSVLSLAASDDYIFSGSQNQDISVWCKSSFRLKHTLRGHTGSVLCLEYAKDKDWLFSSSGDSTVRIWSVQTLSLLYVLEPYLDTGAGDLFSLAYAQHNQTLYIGCQNTSLQWFDFRQLPSPIFNSDRSSASSSNVSKHGRSNSSSSSAQVTTSVPGSGTSTPNPTAAARKVHKFFDSYPQYERKPADIFANNTPLPSQLSSASDDGCVRSLDALLPTPLGYLSIPGGNVIDSAHYGYVYCMALLEGPEPEKRVQLITGSGDETVKLWTIETSGVSNPVPQLTHTFTFAHGAVLSLIARGDTIFAGCQDGYVKVLDVETRACVRTIIVQEGIDVLSVSMIGSDLYTCSANGRIQRWSASFDCTASWQAHGGIILSSIITRASPHGNDNEPLLGLKGVTKAQSVHGWRLVTGGNDSHIKVWEVVLPKERGAQDPTLLDVRSKSVNETMTYALSKFIAIPSVSSVPSHREDCRQAAIWLRKCLGQLGAQASLLPTGEGTNPIVLGTFSGTSKGSQPKPRILFYGHYDVISAPTKGWDSDPFKLTGRNGYLYGRGATDDKGPIIAVACAAADLLARRALAVDLVFLIEGEEECGSAGFGATVRKHKKDIGRADAILLSNSTWIAEDTPCITHGLRGVVHCSIQISSNLPDLHSGVEGGGVSEPMLDMVRLLATLTGDDKRVQIPGFYDNVRPLSEDERQLYTRLAAITQRPAASLASRWREPSLTIHNIQISGPRSKASIFHTLRSRPAT
ncbi:hypothetical protein HGRIS_005868 [Hohenbuehelia grisea]|uniref:Uncharacterized protein n=1 Tax=Hohenbuehelia grisea TaxID=104357 RepID=A0ABR3JYD4_9AGAR